MSRKIHIAKYYNQIARPTGGPEYKIHINVGAGLGAPSDTAGAVAIAYAPGPATVCRNDATQFMAKASKYIFHGVFVGTSVRCTPLPASPSWDGQAFEYDDDGHSPRPVSQPAVAAPRMNGLSEKRKTGALTNVQTNTKLQEHESRTISCFSFSSKSSMATIT